MSPNPQDAPSASTPVDEEQPLDHIAMLDLGPLNQNVADRAARLIETIFAHSGTMVDLPAQRLRPGDSLYMIVETREDPDDDETLEYALVPVVVMDGDIPVPLVTLGIKRALRMALRFAEQLSAGSSYALIAMEAQYIIDDPLAQAHKVLSAVQSHGDSDH